MASKSNRTSRRHSGAAAPRSAAPAATTPETPPEEEIDPAVERRAARREALAALKATRGSDVLIAYVTNTRPGFSAVMMLDAVRRFADHMPAEKVKVLDLFLHTDGGESTVPWRLMTYLREYADVVNVLVPCRAFSAGTLTALGADSIVMHPMGMLGPIDPTVHDPFGPRDEESGQQPGVGVEDVAAFTTLVEEDFKITGSSEMIEVLRLLAERVHPLTLGHVKRGTQQAQMLGRKLLQSRNDPPAEEDIDKLLEDLTRRLYFHGHPINRREATELKLPIEIPPHDVEVAMWKLYLKYEDDLELQEPFDPIAEARRAGAVVPRTVGTSAPIELLENRRVMVESSLRTDVFNVSLEVTLARTEEGAVASNVIGLGAGWSIES